MESEFSIDIPEHVITSEKLSARGNKIIDYIFEPAIVVAVVLSIIFFKPPIQLSDSFAAFIHTTTLTNIFKARWNMQRVILKPCNK